MLAYWKGYEIDGSDTSYNILVPEREKTIEIAKWYLSSKTIDKNKDFRVKIRMGKSEPESYEISFEDRDVLFEMLGNPEICSCEIMYTYMDPNRLYPEIKRQMIDLMTEWTGKGRNFVNPVFDGGGAQREYMEIHFGQREATRLYDISDDVTSQDYILSVKKGSYCAIDVNCSLGAPFCSVMYTLKRVAERFPELEIDVKACADEMLTHYIMSGKSLGERIKVEAFDYTDVLKRILDEPGTFVWHNYYDYRKRCLEPGMLEPANLRIFKRPPYRCSSADPKKDPKQDRYLATVEAVGNVAGDSTKMEPKAYMRYVDKLEKMNMLTDAEFIHYTTVFLQICLAEEKHHAVLLCMRSKGQKGYHMVLDVPAEIRERVERKYGL